MFDLAMPPPYDSWDPLLQRVVVPQPRAYEPATPAATTWVDAAKKVGTWPTREPTSGSLMPPPPPRMSMRASHETPQPEPPSAAPPAVSPATPVPVAAPSADAPAKLSMAEMEEESLRLAYQLQQEEHSAFIQAVRVSESPVPASGGMGPTGAPAEEEMDESLRLAIQLQQEELQWAGGQGGGELDDDMRLAMELSQQGGGDDDDDIM